MKGIVKKKTDRGFGFITPDGDTKDLFFHSSELKNVSFDELSEGDAVTFEVVNGEKGKSAVNVNRV